MTAGTDGKTIDGMGMARINALIEKMRDSSYQPNPARRTYIPKSNGKMRPLGIPSFDDKLIQEVVRLILESIYEPTFSDHSHGFRMNKSCHTALKYVQKYFTGTKWFVEGDIKGCFDNVDHHVLIAILRKLVPEHKDRIIYAAMVILAANAGGAFSPIGDVTTIMLWINGSITSLGVIEELFVPSVVSVVVPTLVLSLSLKGQLGGGDGKEAEEPVYLFTKAERNLLFIIGVGGLVFVPVFRHLTGLPPFMGVLLVLSLLWIVTEIHYMKIPGSPSSLHRVSELLRRVDFSTLLFFLGILMTVASLEEIGVLHSFGEWLDTASGGNSFIVTGIIGLVSAIVDNVPLVASCMGMYEIAGPAAGAEMAHFMVDGSFWQLLAFCAGTGGSILIIGSAAGVAVMGLEKISFGWYLKHVSWLALLGYFAGMIVYWLQLEFIFG